MNYLVLFLNRVPKQEEVDAERVQDVKNDLFFGHGIELCVNGQYRMAANFSTSKNPVLHVVVVGFHHKKGCQVINCTQFCLQAKHVVVG